MSEASTPTCSAKDTARKPTTVCALDAAAGRTADVFVYHAGGLSFGARRARLLARSQRLLNLRYPGYDGFIAGFLSRDPIQPLRRTLDERRLLGMKGRLALLVTLALTGGVD